MKQRTDSLMFLISKFLTIKDWYAFIKKYDVPDSSKIVDCQAKVWRDHTLKTYTEKSKEVPLNRQYVFIYYNKLLEEFPKLKKLLFVLEVKDPKFKQNMNDQTVNQVEEMS